MQLARTEIGDTTGIRGVVRDGGERGAREDVWWVWWVLDSPSCLGSRASRLTVCTT